MSIEQRRYCVLYLTATCNLNCIYCYIDKSPALMRIDKMLEETWATDYFFNFMKDMFPDPKQLTQIEFWGGEPSYGLYRAIKTSKQAIEYYPNLTQFFMSTNLTTATFCDDFYNFLQIFKDYPNRHFTFDLQLSLDGPTEINDKNRGQGTTKKFIDNFAKLLSSIGKVLDDIPNLNILAHFKPTLDIPSIATLQTKEAVLKYYNFFGKLSNSARRYGHQRFSLSTPAPNVATPSPHTKQDGINFANFCKSCYEVMKEDKETPILVNNDKYIMPFQAMLAANRCPFGGLTNGCNTCGTGVCILGLLPNRLISACHNGFVDLLEDYKKSLLTNLQNGAIVDYKTTDNEIFKRHESSKVLYTEEEYALYEKRMSCWTSEHTWQVAELTQLIQLLARCGQIENKYINIIEARKGAHFIFESTNSCVRDNLGVSGSLYLFQVGHIKLFLNGAKEWIELAEQEFLGRTR